MGLSGTALRFRVRSPVGAGDDGMADQVGHDGGKVIKSRVPVASSWNSI